MRTSIRWPVFFCKYRKGDFILFWLKGTHIYCLKVLKVRDQVSFTGPPSRCSRGHTSSGGSREHLFLCLFQLLELHSMHSWLEAPSSIFKAMLRQLSHYLLPLFCSQICLLLIRTLDHQIIIKGFNSGTARWKRCRGKGMEKACGVFVLCPSVTFSPNFHMFTTLEVPLKMYYKM